MTGTRALVTGAASGIGRATVERLRARGAQVVGIDRDDADVGVEEEVERAVARAVEELGGLDVVVANAGVQLHGRDALTHELELDAWEETLRTNLTGVFLTCKHGLRALLAGGRGGAIVCVASAAAVTGVARTYHAYTASKGGVLALVRVLAADYAEHGIRVNAVLPGFVDTPLVAPVTADEEWLANVLSLVPAGRAGTPEEVADAIEYLASDRAAFVTGAALTVDGGLTSV